MSYLSLKVNLNDIERRRFRIPEDFSLADFITKINLLFQNRIPENYTLLYRDDDQDWVNFETEDEWNEAKWIAKASTQKTLVVKMVTPEIPLPPPSISPSSSVSQREREDRQVQEEPQEGSEKRITREHVENTAHHFSSRASSELEAIQQSVQSAMRDIRHAMRDVQNEATRYSSTIPNRVRQAVRDSGISEYVSDRQIRNMVDDVVSTFSEAATDLSGQVNDAWISLRRHMSNSNDLIEYQSLPQQEEQEQNQEQEQKQEQTIHHNEIEEDSSTNYSKINENIQSNQNQNASKSYFIDVNVTNDSVSVSDPYSNNPVLNNILSEGLSSSGLSQQYNHGFDFSSSSYSPSIDYEHEQHENEYETDISEEEEEEEEEWSIIPNQLVNSEYGYDNDDNDDVVENDDNINNNEEREENENENENEKYSLRYLKYEKGLDYLREMGFNNDQVNLDLLEKHDGDVPRVVMELIR